MLLTSSASIGSEAASEVIDQISNLSSGDQKVDPNAIQKFLKDLPDNAFNFAVRVGFCLLAFYIGTRIIKLVLKMVRKSMEHANADTGVITFIVSFVKACLYIVLIFTILACFGVNATSVAAVLGSAGVAIGLAVQGSLSNFAGGVLILMLKPFVVGDYIKEDTHNNEGTVTEIRIFYTKLLTAEGRVVILPNGTLANTSLTNFSSDYNRASSIKIGISYQSDLQKAKDLLVKVMENDPIVLKEKPYSVIISDLSDSAVILSMSCSFHVKDYYVGRSQLLEKAKETLDQAGIEIPYKKLDVYIQGN